jgi:hypothetical protein
MSALPPKADMFSVELDVCFVPKADLAGWWPEHDIARTRTPSDLLKARLHPFYRDLRTPKAA